MILSYTRIVNQHIFYMRNHIAILPIFLALGSFLLYGHQRLYHKYYTEQRNDYHTCLKENVKTSAVVRS